MAEISTRAIAGNYTLVDDINATSDASMGTKSFDTITSAINDGLVTHADHSKVPNEQYFQWFAQRTIENVFRYPRKTGPVGRG